MVALVLWIQPILMPAVYGHKTTLMFDIANTGKLGSYDVVYGISANNNPTVQDPWNTTPLGPSPMPCRASHRRLPQER